MHFHSYPILSRASQEKARELVDVLTRFQYDSRLFLVPSARSSSRSCCRRAPLRVVIYRRLMMRIAEAIARRKRAQALVTGEVVGQVASQTLENLAAIDRVVTMPVLRPLIGMDKDEITAEAQRLGTYPDLDHSRPGLLHAVHAAASGDKGAPGRRRARRGGVAARHDRHWRGRRRGSRAVLFPGEGEALGCPGAATKNGDGDFKPSTQELLVYQRGSHTLGSCAVAYSIAARCY